MYITGFRCYPGVSKLSLTQRDEQLSMLIPATSGHQLVALTLTISFQSFVSSFSRLSIQTQPKVDQISSIFPLSLSFLSPLHPPRHVLSPFSTLHPLFSILLFEFFPSYAFCILISASFPTFLPCHSFILLHSSWTRVFLQFLSRLSPRTLLELSSTSLLTWSKSLAAICQAD